MLQALRQRKHLLRLLGRGAKKPADDAGELVKDAPRSRPPAAFSLTSWMRRSLPGLFPLVFPVSRLFIPLRDPVAEDVRTQTESAAGGRRAGLFLDSSVSERVDAREGETQRKRTAVGGYLNSDKQPETFAIQGSNETGGYPHVGIPLGIGKPVKDKVIPRRDCP
jgi:hypothetical protein